MASVNKVILVGNLGKDPEVRRMNSGDAVCNLTVATSESWTKDGEKHERTEWHRVVIFGKLAEVAEKYLRKGSKVYLEGQLQTRKWQDQSGNDRYSTEVVLRGFGASMVMLDGKAERDSGPVMDRGQSGRDGGDDRGCGSGDGRASFDDEIPF